MGYVPRAGLRLTVGLTLDGHVVWGDISSIPGDTVIPLWLGRHCLVYGNRVYHEKVLITLSGVPRNFVRGGSTNSVEDRENGDLGAVAP